MHTIHYDNGFGLPACGVRGRARLSRNPNDVGCWQCELRIPATLPYQLPDGRIVEIRSDVACGAEMVTFELADGREANATRYEARR